MAERKEAQSSNDSELQLSSKEIKKREEQATIRQFFNNLWTESGLNLDGDTTQVVRRDTVYVSDEQSQRLVPSIVELDPIPIGLKKLIDNGLESWREITERVLVAPEKNYKNVSFREPNIQRLNRELTVPSDEPFKPDKILLKLLQMRFGADLYQKNDNVYPPDPENGRPQVSVSLVELFRDTRRTLYDRIEAASIEQKLLKLGQIQNTVNVVINELSQADSLTFRDTQQIIQSLGEAPTSILTVIGRNIYFDEGLSSYQPINTIGFMKYQTLTGIRFYRLAAWKNYNSWDPFPEDFQRQISFNYGNVDKLIDLRMQDISRYMLTG